MFSLIVPSASPSLYDYTNKPSWMHKHPNGNLMIVESIKGLNLEIFDSIIIIVLKKHLEMFGSKSNLLEAFSQLSNYQKVQIVVLSEKTRNQAETVYWAINKLDIQGAIFVKDSDNYYKADMYPINCISTYSLNSMTYANPQNKSYLDIDENDNIINIVENQIVSSFFNVGGYGFKSVEDFKQQYEKLRDEDSLFLSHIVFSMLLNDEIFKALYVEDYIDWGSYNDWIRFKDEFGNVFIDVENLILSEDVVCFENNVGRINELYNTGKYKIILLTQNSEEEIIEKLKGINIQYHKIVDNLFFGKELLVTPFDNIVGRTNKHISVKSKSDDLRFLL